MDFSELFEKMLEKLYVVYFILYGVDLEYVAVVYVACIEA